MILSFVLASLACWRLTSLLIYEEGPGRIFERLREWLGASPSASWDGLLDCFWCMSVWVAIPLAALAWWPDVRLMIVGWLAVSTGAIIIDELILPRGGE